MDDDYEKSFSKILERELLEQIEITTSEGDYDSALKLIDEYIEKIGSNQHIALMRENILKLKGEKSPQLPAPAAPAAPESEWKVVSAYDELHPQDEGKSAKPAPAKKPPAPSPKASPAEEEPPAEIRITDDDIMELSEEMTASDKLPAPEASTPNVPTPSTKPKKEDTRPFDISQFDSIEPPDEDLALHVPFLENGTKTGTQLDNIDLQKELAEVPEFQPGYTPVPEPIPAPVEAPAFSPPEPPAPPAPPLIASELPPTPAGEISPTPAEELPAAEPPPPQANEDIIPPADKEFVQQLEMELSKARKKPNFAPSFLKTPQAKPSTPTPSYGQPSTSPWVKPISLDIPFEKEEIEPLPPRSSPTLKSAPKGKSRLPLYIGGGVLAAAAIAALLFFSGILGSKKKPESALSTASQERPATQQPQRTTPAQPQSGPASTPGSKTTPPPETGTPPQKESAPTPEQRFDQTMTQAENYFKEGRYDKAWELLLLAKKFRVDLRTMALEGKIQEKEMELSSSLSQRQEEAVAKKDDTAFQNAQKSDIRTAYEGYLKAYPMGLHITEALSRIKELENEEKANFQKRVMEKAKQQKELNLRNQALYISRDKLEESVKKVRRIQGKSENREGDGYLLVIDYATGLMWIRIEKPVDLDKARLFFNRHYLNYSDWRMPTVEEAASLPDLIPNPYNISTAIAVWTSDRDAEKRTTNWVIELPSLTLSLAEDYKFYYLFVVRSISPN